MKPYPAKGTKQSKRKLGRQSVMNPTQTKTMNQSQKLMVFVLTMSLYGLVEFSVEYFLFIPLVLAMLFDPL